MFPSMQEFFHGYHTYIHVEIYYRQFLDAIARIIFISMNYKGSNNIQVTSSTTYGKELEA